MTKKLSPHWQGLDMPALALLGPGAGDVHEARGDMALERAWRRFARSWSLGAHIVETQYGHSPIKLALGGVLLWAFFVSLMFADGSSAATIADGLARAVEDGFTWR